MKKFLTLLRISIIDAFEYRADMLIFVLSNISQPLVLLGMWLGVLVSGGVTPLSRDGFVQYYLLLFVVSLWTNAWASVFIVEKIRLGNLSPYLLRPAHYILVVLSENIGEKLIKFLLIFPILLIIIYIFNPAFPEINIINLTLFLLSLLMAAIMVFSVDVVMGILAFWMDETLSVENFYDALLFLFSGRLIPLIAMPVLIQKIGVYLPFRYTLSFPIEILLSQISTAEICLGFFWQVIWCGTSVLILFMLWNRGIKRYSASGA